MAAAPNASMGLLNLGRCGGFLPTPQPNWSPACGFLVSGRSVSVSPLRWGLVRKKGRVFDSRTAGAVASGDAGAGSSELRHIEKELTFSPTFTDYVKIMESVKLDRCKNLQGADLDVRSSRRRFTGDGDASVVRKGDRRSGAARNKSFERGKGNQRNRRNDRGRGVNLEKSGSQKNVTRFADKRKLDDVENIRGRQGKIEQYVQRRIIRGDRSEIGGNGQFASHEKAKDSRDSMVVHQSGTIPQGVHSSDSLKFDKPEIIHMQRGGNIKTGKFIRRDAEATDFDDRAAFKTFEVFTDVRNRPRILRMEMEERIQKLASLLNATYVNTPEWKFSKMIHDAKIKFSDHSILRIVQILGRFGNWKCVLEVVEWLQSRERFKSYKSRYIYTTVLDVLGKAKRPFEALNVFYTMQNQLSSYPDMAAYHCIAVTLGQAGLVKELFDVLNACVQQKQWEGAFWVLQQLKVKNIRPTNTTYGLVMEVMLACGKYSLVYEFFNKVEKSSIPGAPNYKVLINALWREGKIDEAVMAVEDMESRGVVGSAGLYYDLARCLCSGGRCEEALLQVEKICKVAKKPLVVTYTGLIQTCIDNGSMENAKYIFNEMCNYCSPNNVTCNIMMKSYVEYGMFEDAKDLLQNILNGRIRGKVDPNQNAIADKFTFNTFMEACAEAKRWNDFEYAFRGMLSNGRHFDGRRHLRMVLDAYRNGKEQLLDDIWRYLCHHSRVPPGPIIMERFCLKLIQGDTTAAISCVSRFQEGKIRSVSSMLWLNLLNRNADRLKEENITKLVHELNNLVSSCSSSDCLYQSILSSCTTFLSGATSVEMAPFDQQMALHNS